MKKTRLIQAFSVAAMAAIGVAAGSSIALASVAQAQDNPTHQNSGQLPTHPTHHNVGQLPTHPAKPNLPRRPGMALFSVASGPGDPNVGHGDPTGPNVGKGSPGGPNVGSDNGTSNPVGHG